MFDELSQKLDHVLSRFRQRGLLTEPMIRDGLREIRRILLEADVNYALAREFLGRVEQRALGQRVLKSVSPGQQIVKVVHAELAALLGEGPSQLAWARTPPTVMLVVGLQGSGKTTTVAKLAKRLRREGRRPLLVACDPYRPAAVEQLVTLGERIGVSVHPGPTGVRQTDGDVVGLAAAALERARREHLDVLVVDTAGRLQIDEPMMDELRRLRAKLGPTEILLVVDAMIGQEAVSVARGFDQALGLTGVILTKLDGDARGGAALSIHGVTGKPIKFVGVGEQLDDLEPCDPYRLAGRILQMGDVVGLVERAERTVEQEERERLERKVVREGRFDLEDFLAALRQLQRMGPLEQLLKLVPGVNQKLVGQVGLEPKRIKHVEAIVLSMTPEERRRPEILNASRRARIARGSGRPVSEINRLLKQFREMEKMLKRMRGLARG
ncbi:MAG: signal recognition particle protein [Gemmatimonadetes bacterium]|nr:signal recognition particle protein [Gemmatimonadota bacterium]